MAVKEKTSAKKKKDIKIVSGVLKVTTTENNTLIILIDEKGNKVLIEFPDIKRNYMEDSYFIEESAHGVVDSKDLKIFEKFIDSKELYVIFEKNDKYPIKLPYPVRNAILDVIRKYKLMQES